eukprot:3914076-Rhodomonas_salina.7
MVCVFVCVSQEGSQGTHPETPLATLVTRLSDLLELLVCQTQHQQGVQASLWQQQVRANSQAYSSHSNRACSNAVLVCRGPVDSEAGARSQQDRRLLQPGCRWTLML